MKYIIIALIGGIALVGGAFYYFTYGVTPGSAQNPGAASSTDAQQGVSPVATSTDTTTPKAEEVIGNSVENRAITAYHFGNGNKEILFVAGLHGGYEWNTILLANQLIEHLKANPSAVPAGVRVTVIPNMNPDGLSKVVSNVAAFTAADVASSQATQIMGRFNANKVDLNRNFDCDWQPSGTWQTKAVSGGEKAFSEPESQAMKNYIEAHKPAAVVVWYSSAGGVYSSNCHGGVLPETAKLTNVYAKASGYPAYETFDYYSITGDMVNWLAKLQIPAISVLLSNHTDTEWAKNKAGIEAMLALYAETR